MSDPVALRPKGEPAPSDNKDAITSWMRKITSSQKREEKWRKYAKKLCDIYEAETVRQNSFNILFSNTETLRPAVLSAIPRPRVKKRWDDQDAISVLAAKAVERALTFMTDPGSAAISVFGTTLKEAVRSGLVAGRGLTLYQYEPEFGPPGDYGDAGKDADAKGDDTDTDGEDEEGETTPSNVVTETPTGPVTQENICCYPLTFDRVTFGYAESWADLPWLAISYEMTQEDVEKNFGAEKAKACKYVKDSGEVSDSDRKKEPDESAGMPDTCLVYAVWHRQDKTVYYVSEGYPDDFLDSVPDPLHLTGFWPIPEQLVFFSKAGSLIPVPLYKFYEEQAKELNNISQRINKIISVMKARGIYDNTIKEIAEMASKEDGQLTPAKNVQGLVNTGGLSSAIWMWPISDLINVLQQLYVQRGQVKDVIYEITGLSDIIRGSSVASETATAQTIKNQWGTLRLRDTQDTVGLYARNGFRIMAEIAINKFGVPTWERMTQLGLMTADQQAQAKQLIATLQQQFQSSQPTASASSTPMQPPGSMPGGQAPQGSAPTPPPPSGQPPQGGPQPSAPMTSTGQTPSAPGAMPPPQAPSASPAPPQPSPEQMQQFADLQKKVAQPTWDQVLQELKQNVVDGYLIDIETNSTLNAEAQEDKQDIADLVQGLASLVQGLGPAVQSGAVPPDFGKAILLMSLSHYRFGDDLAEMIKNMPQGGAQQNKPDPAAMKAQAEMQLIQAKIEGIKETQQIELQGRQMDMQMKQQEMGFKQQQMQAEHDMTMSGMSMKAQEQQAASQARLATIQQKMQLAQMQQPVVPNAGI